MGPLTALPGWGLNGGWWQSGTGGRGDGPVPTLDSSARGRVSSRVIAARDELVALSCGAIMRMSSRTCGALLVVTLGLVACSRSAPPAAPPQSAQVVRGTPLPPGWAWPPTAGMLASVGAQPGIVRPVDAARLRSTRTSNGCRPMEVVPGFFVMAPCAPLPMMLNGSKGVRRQRTQIALPPQVDLRATGQDGPVKDQQQVGVCWSFAISS